MLTTRLTPPYGETTWLQWRMSFSTKLYYFSILALLAYLIYSDIIYGQFYKKVKLHDFIGFYGSWALLAAVTAFIIHLDRGYRVAFDDEAIYTRPHGMRWNFKRYPFIRIPFDEIALVRGEWQRSPPVKTMPFQYARVYRRDWDGVELFPLVGGELLDIEFKELLQLIDKKAPGTLSEEVAAYMNSDYRF